MGVVDVVRVVGGGWWVVGGGWWVVGWSLGGWEVVARSAMRMQLAVSSVSATTHLGKDGAALGKGVDVGHQGFGFAECTTDMA